MTIEVYFAILEIFPPINLYVSVSPPGMPVDIIERD